MAGMVRVGGHTWTASYGLFDWVLETVAEQVHDAGAASTMREIVQHTLGYLDVDDLGDGAPEVLAVLRRLREVAARTLPPSPVRGEVIEHVGRLAAAAGDA